MVYPSEVQGRGRGLGWVRARVRVRVSVRIRVRVRVGIKVRVRVQVRVRVRSSAFIEVCERPGAGGAGVGRSAIRKAHAATHTSYEGRQWIWGPDGDEREEWIRAGAAIGEGEGVGRVGGYGWGLGLGLGIMCPSEMASSA